MNTKKNSVIRKIVLALMLISVSTAVNAAYQIGAFVGSHDSYIDPVTGQRVFLAGGCTDIQSDTASCANGVYGSASATLTSGDISVYANNGGAVITGSNGTLQDILYFGGSIPSGGHVVFSMSASGALVGDAVATLHLNAGLSQFGSPSIPAPSFGVSAANSSNVIATCTHPGNFLDINQCVSTNGTDKLSLSLDLPLYYVDPSYGFNFSASLGCEVNGPNGGNYGTCNFNDPITITLPAGVTFTSASGQFLTAPVPIPTAVWLFGSGLLGLVGVARRKHSQS